MVLENFLADADILWDRAGKKLFEKPEAHTGRIMRVQVTNRGVVEDLTGYTLNLGWTSTKDETKIGLDAFEAADITKGIFELEYTSGMLTNIGTLKAALQLVPVAGNTVESDNFVITVTKSAVDAAAVQSETSFTALASALVSVNDWNARIDAVEADFIQRANDMEAIYPQQLLSLGSQLADKVGNGVKAELEDLSATVIGAIDGTGGPFNLLSVPQDLSVNGAKLTSDLLDNLKGKINAALLDGVFVASKNLFDKNNLYSTSKYFIHPTTGVFTTTNYELRISGKIPLDSREEYITLSATNVMDSTIGYRFLDSKGNQLAVGALNGAATMTIAKPYNAVYFETSFAYTNINTLQVEYGQTANAYEAYLNDKLNIFPLIKQLSKTTSGKNMFNKHDLYANGESYFYLRPTTGALTGTGYKLFVSSPILIDNAKGYLQISTDEAISSSQGYRFLDLYGNIVGVGAYDNTNRRTIAIPTNAAYFQTTADNIHLETMQIEYGQTATTYSIFVGNRVSPLYDVYLPGLIKVSKNKQHNIYYDGLFNKPYNKPVSARITSFKGLTNYNRLATIMATEADKTSKPANVEYVVDKLEKMSKVVYYKVVDAAARTDKTLNAMVVGDSFTEMGWWVDSILEKASIDGVTINTIGLMDTNDGLGNTENQTGGRLSTSFMAARTEATYKVSVTGITARKFNIHYQEYETYSANGYTWTVSGAKIDSSGNGYLRLTSASAGATIPTTGTLTKVSGLGDESIAFTASEAVNRNPFWNNATGLLDFSYYIDKWGFTAPDVLAFMFGWNDYSAWQQPQAFIDSCKAFVDQFHIEYPDAKVIISVPPYGYTKEPRNDVNGVKYSRLWVAKKLFTTFTSYTFVDIVPVYAFVDSINGFDSNTITPSSRYAETITLGGDEVHNNEAGMKQIGDAVYPYLIDTLV